MASVASSVARSCAQPASRAVNARRDRFPADIVSFWPVNPSLVGVRSSAVGPDLTWSYTGNMYDADGVSIGANPPFHAGKGLYGGPAVTNLLPSGKEDLTSWSKINSTVTMNADGSFRHTATGTSGTELYVNVNTLSNGSQYTLSRQVKKGSCRYCTLGLFGLADAYFDLEGLNYNIVGSGCLAARIIPKKDGYVEISATWTWGSGTTYRAFMALASSLSSQAATIGMYIDVKFPQLTQSAYPLPYVPPGTTQPSAAATTGGNGPAVAMDQKILEAFRGKPDGVELCTTLTKGDNASVTKIGPQTWRITDLTGTGSGDAALDLITTAGARYLISVTNVAGNGWTPTDSDAWACWDAGFLNGRNGPYIGNTVEITAANNSLLIRPVNNVAANETVDVNISIQRLAPAVCTVMHECFMGVGSGDLAVATTNHSLLTGTMVQEGVFYFRGEGPRIVSSYDGLSAAFKYSSWSPNEIHRRYVQTNTTGTKFRVGYERFSADMTPITNGIVWSHATADAGANFDGSFNPLQWLRFGLNLTVPIWHRKTWISQQSLSDAQIQARNNLVRY